MNDRPKARTEQLIPERIDDELVIYDQLNRVAHCLSHDAVLVWDHCDGRLTESEIAHRLTCRLEAVQRAVGALDERRLLRRESGRHIRLLPPPGGDPIAQDRRRRTRRAAGVFGGRWIGRGGVFALSPRAASSPRADRARAPAAVRLWRVGAAGTASTNSMCASGRCYCRFVNSSGGAQTVFRCAIGSTCHGDANANCAGQRSPGHAAVRRTPMLR